MKRLNYILLIASLAIVLIDFAVLEALAWRRRGAP
jgi:hypothetical protein